MDPNECYKRMTSDTTDPKEVLHHVVDLYDWLHSGGFRPHGVSRDEITDAMFDAVDRAIDELRIQMFVAEIVDDNEDDEDIIGCPRCAHEWPHKIGPPCPKCGY